VLVAPDDEVEPLGDHRLVDARVAAAARVAILVEHEDGEVRRAVLRLRAARGEGTVARRARRRARASAAPGAGGRAAGRRNDTRFCCQRRFRRSSRTLPRP